MAHLPDLEHGLADFAVFLGALILHESLSWRVALGGAFVLASAWIILRSRV